MSTINSATVATLILLIALCISMIHPQKSVAEEFTFSCAEYPPFRGENLHNNGLLADVVQQALALKGHKVKFFFVPWARALKWAEDGRSDGIIGLWYTEERAKPFLFSDPIANNYMVFYKRKGEDIVFDHYTDLARQGKTAAGVIGYVYPTGLEESGIISVLASDEAHIFTLLAEKRVDLIVVDRDFASFQLSSPPLSQYKDKLEPFTTLEIKAQYLAISRKSKHAKLILNDFNSGLLELKQSGKFDQIFHYHLQLKGQ